jgi:RNA polymerase sigma factor (sigma-70 family)
LSMLTTDRRTIEQAFIRHRIDVYRFLLRRTRDHYEAEELTQQVFAEAASALSRGGPPRSMRGWLFAVAERRFVDELRRRERVAKLVELIAAEPPLTHGEATPTLENAVARLPDQQQQLVVMRIVEGRTYREIALVLECNEAACRMRLSRALSRLRDELAIAS